jgi:hypothetical protein
MKPLIILLLTTVAVMAQQPVPKTGQCPSGYAESGGYCAPTSDRVSTAVPKIQGKQCPSGYSQSGAYCLKMGR